MTPHPTRGATRSLMTRSMVFALAAFAIVAAMATNPGRAEAAVHTEDLHYSGHKTHTRTFADEVANANLPDFLPDKLDGRMRVRVVLETTTRASVRAYTHFSSTPQSTFSRGENITVSLANQSFDGSSQANMEFVVGTTPALHIFVDIEPDNADPFECTPTAFAKGGPLPATVGPTGDGDAKCHHLRITADDLPGLDLPAEFILIQQSLAMPYGGTRNFHNESELFRIPVCKIVSRMVPPLAFLGDHCRIRVVGTADAQLLLDTPTEGFNAVGKLRAHTPSAAGPAQLTVVGDPQSLHWTSASPVSKTYTIPCNALPDTPLTYTVENNTYSGRVRKVELGVKLYFHVDIIGDVASFDLGEALGRLDLLQGQTLSVTSNGPNVNAVLGTVKHTSAASCGSAVANLRASIQRSEATVYTDTTQRWTVRVQNLGGATSGTAKLTVTLPSAYVNVQMANPNGWTCLMNGRIANCTRTGPIEANGFSPGFVVTARQASGVTCGSTAKATAAGTLGSVTIAEAQDQGAVMNCSRDPVGDGLPDPHCVPTATDDCD